MKSLPRYLLIVFALAGDSTITRFFAIAIQTRSATDDTSLTEGCFPRQFLRILGGLENNINLGGKAKEGPRRGLGYLAFHAISLGKPAVLRLKMAQTSRPWESRTRCDVPRQTLLLIRRLGYETREISARRADARCSDRLSTTARKDPLPPAPDLRSELHRD
jgi:hypothetical protein